MDKINKLYEDVKNYKDVLTEYNLSKNRLQQLEQDVNNCKTFLEGQEKLRLLKKTKQLEKDLEIVEKEIKKIDLLSKEVYTLGDLKIMCDYVVDEGVLKEKTVSFLESLVVPFYVSFEEAQKLLKGEKNLKTHKNKSLKVLKIKLEVEEVLEIAKNNNELFLTCIETYKRILRTEMGLAIPSRLVIFKGDDAIFLLLLDPCEADEEEVDSIKGLLRVSNDFLCTLVHSRDLFNDIFKKNLQKLLLLCSVVPEDVEETNEFFNGTEFYLTNVDEWKLDCSMKEIILLSKKKRKWDTVNWLEEEALKDDNKYYESKNVSKLTIGKEINALPEEISMDLFRILLCIKVVYSCNSKRINKAEKIIEQALLKFANQETQGTLLQHFIVFADLTALARVFPDTPIASFISTLRENTFYNISQLSTEITRSLNESLLLLKIYFKEKHFDFVVFVNKFVPQKSRMAFEINFFNLLYAHICDLILCINFMDNEKAGDLARLLQYVLCLSCKVPSDCIESHKRIEAYAFVLQAPREEVEARKPTLSLTPSEYKKLIQLLFK